MKSRTESIVDRTKEAKDSSSSTGAKKSSVAEGSSGGWRQFFSGSSKADKEADMHEHRGPVELGEALGY